MSPDAGGPRLREPLERGGQIMIPRNLDTVPGVLMGAIRNVN